MTDKAAADAAFQSCVPSLTAVHLSHCKNPDCYAKRDFKPRWFCVLPADLEGDCIPDSLQAGHGLRLEVPFRYLTQTVRANSNEQYLCTTQCGSSTIKVTCNCDKPGLHAGLFRALCKCYNGRT